MFGHGPSFHYRATAAALSLVFLAGCATSVPELNRTNALANKTINLSDTDATTLQQFLTAGELTSVQLVAAYLDRIGTYEFASSDQPGINAITNLNPRAVADAVSMDEERARGHIRGPLHGIPVLVKDVVDVSGLPTTGALESLRELVVDDDATQVQLLRQAGAIILGKTNVLEVDGRGAGSFGGDTRNPYDQSRHPGFSSGGAGAAVAAGFAPISLAEDTFGSVRIPAALTNLVGLRPTAGLTSLNGVQRLSWTYDTLGPITTSVRDAALVLDATVGYDPTDPRSVDVDKTDDGYTSQLDTKALEGKRIGVLDAWFSTDTPDRAATSAVIRAAVDQMEALGASIVHAEIPTTAMDDFSSIGRNIIGFELPDAQNTYLSEHQLPAVAALSAPTDTLTRADLQAFSGALDPADPAAVAQADAPTVSESDYRTALAARERFATAVAAYMKDNNLDALVYPSMQQPASPLGTSDPFLTERLASEAGLPALSLPAGLVGQMPVGIELMGRAFDEATLLSMGYAFEQGTDHRNLPTTTPQLK